jgi:voltage-gated potassium channel
MDTGRPESVPYQLFILALCVYTLPVETVSESNIKTAGDARWWPLSTITTVGYTDRYPVTTEGPFVAALLVWAGVGLFGMLSGFLAARVVRVPNRWRSF